MPVDMLTCGGHVQSEYRPSSTSAYDVALEVACLKHLIVNIAVALQSPRVHGPPKYYTINWQQSRESVRRLADLRPRIAATGHGTPMTGAAMLRQLDQLVQHFDPLAVPRRGRYISRPATVYHDGSLNVPPAPLSSAIWRGAIGVVLLAFVYKALRS